MAEWRSREFDKEEGIVGHGRENLAGEVRDFLNENKITPGEAMIAGYRSVDHKGNPFVHAILWYYK